MRIDETLAKIVVFVFGDDAQPSEKAVRQFVKNQMNVTHSNVDRREIEYVGVRDAQEFHQERLNRQGYFAYISTTSAPSQIWGWLDLRMPGEGK